MKKFVSILAVLMLAVLTLVPVTGAFAGGSDDTQCYIVADNGKYVNLRSRPNGSLVARLGVGKPVTLISDDGSGWVMISAKVDGETVKGYVMSEYVGYDDPTEDEQIFVRVNRFQVAVTPSKGENGHVNLRSRASADSTCLRYLYKDDVLTVLEESNAWYKVRTEAGTVGYVVKAFVTKWF